MRNALAAALTLGLLLGGCNRSTNTQQAASPPAASSEVAQMTPEQLGELGAQIKKEPQKADQLLSERGLTRESFEKEIRKITENPDASKRYAAAFKAAS